MHKKTSKQIPYLSLGLLLLSLSGCADDLPPASKLDGLRILAIEASPLEVGLGEAVTLRAVTYAPQGTQIASRRWSFCPLTLGAASGFACIAPSCEVPIEPTIDGSITARPDELAIACLDKAAQAQPNISIPGTSIESLGESAQTIFRHRIQTIDGEAREAVMRINLWLASKPPIPNRPVRFTSIALDQTTLTEEGSRPKVKRGNTHTFHVLIDPASLDEFRDSSGHFRKEEPVISFYSTAGEFAADRDTGTSVTMEWHAPHADAPPQEVTFYITARDLRGGQTVAGPFFAAVE